MKDSGSVSARRHSILLRRGPVLGRDLHPLVVDVSVRLHHRDTAELRVGVPTPKRGFALIDDLRLPDDRGEVGDAERRVRGAGADLEHAVSDIARHRLGRSGSDRQQQCDRRETDHGNLQGDAACRSKAARQLC